MTFAIYKDSKLLDTYTNWKNAWARLRWAGYKGMALCDFLEMASLGLEKPGTLAEAEGYGVMVLEEVEA